MRRAIVFTACLAAGSMLLLWQAGGLEGPRARMREPEMGTAPPVAGGHSIPILPSPGTHEVLVKDIGPSFYPRTEPRTFRDPRTGERVDIPHFVAWTFKSRSGKPVPGSEAPEGAIVFEDVEVHAYRAPATLEEARRLRDDPRAIDSFARLVVFAPRARADGVAALLRTRGTPSPAVRDWTIRLDGDVRIRDLAEQVEMRGPALTFDPEAGRAEGAGTFTVEHEAWTIQGEELTIVRDLRVRDVYRIDVGRNVVLALRGGAAGVRGRAPETGPGTFRPARVLARRASLLHDETGGERVHVVLEGEVRATQEGGRRLLADRLQLTAEALTPGHSGATRAWTVVDLDAAGKPVALEAPDLAVRAGEPAGARITARTLRYERSPTGAETTVLEGDPVLVLLGSLALPGMPGRGRWIRASAQERAVLSDIELVTRDGAGPVRGRRLELRGAARLERRGAGADPFQDVLEGDEVELTLRPGSAPDQEQPVAFAALGHVRLSGTRLAGETEQLRVEGLDTVTPSILVRGMATRLTLLGLSSRQRLLSTDQEPEPGTGPSAAPHAADGELTWRLDRLEASGRVAAETRLGGPTIGVPAWIEADRALYERLDERATLTGLGASPASVRVDAGGDRRHGLVAPTISFEAARGVVRAEGGAQGDIHLGSGGARSLAPGGGLGDSGSGRPSALTLTTDGQIEVRFRLSKVGGDPLPGVTQVLRIPGPFEAHVEDGAPDRRDRMRADRLDAAFVLLPAQAAAPGPRVMARAPRGAGEAASTAQEPGQRSEHWRLSARTLAFALTGSRLDSLDAEGGVVVDGESFHVEGRTLHFDGPFGALRLEGTAPRPGGVPRARARFGAAGAESTVEASALSAQLGADGPRWLVATGPVQALWIETEPGPLAATARFEVDCRGDVRLTRTEMATVGTAETWLRRTERAPGGSDWTAAAEVWTQRLVVRGRDLLAGGAAGSGAKARDARRIERVIAEGPNTAFASGVGERRVEMWCERIEIDVAEGTAALSGAPGRDVRLRRGGEIESELLRAKFDFRTGAVHDMEAAGIVLRKGR